MMFGIVLTAQVHASEFKVGFGTFKTSIRKASQGRNPRTNEVIQIPQSTRPKFTAGKGLKEAVNNAGGM